MTLLDNASTETPPTAPLWSFRKRAARSLTAAAVTGLMLFATACGTTETAPNDAASSPQASASASASVEATPSASADPKDTLTEDVVASLAEDGVQLSGKVLGNKNGE